MKETIGFGIVGCGVISPWHAGSILKVSDAKLVAVCDIIKDKAETLAANHGSPKVYMDYEQMLRDPEVDAVCVCTPSGMHADMGILAAKAGKHILTEKPIDIRLPKIDELIRTARECGVKLAVIFQRRTSSLWQTIARIVASGALGKMVLGDAYLKYFRSQEYYDSGDWRGTWALDGGGALMNQGVHCVDLLQWVMGPVESVFAHADHLVRHIEVEDTAVAALKFRNGAFGVIEGTTSVCPGMNHRLEFHGEKGTIAVDGETVVHWDMPDDTPDITGDTGTKAGVDIKLGSAASSPTSIAMEGHRILIADLVAAIKEDRDPLITGEEARKSVEMILGIYESARTGRPVRFPLS